MSHLLERLSRTGVVCLVAFAVSAHVVLLLGWGVPAWLLPLSLALGALAAALPVAVDGTTARVRPWVAGVAALVLVACVLPVVSGAVATPDRDWDGFVSWSMRARYLVPPAGLDQPVFDDPAVYAHSRAYPLLQPLLLGSSTGLLGPQYGRLCFPALFALLFAVAGTAVRRATGSGEVGLAAAVCLAVTPMWLNPSAGAVDSGYAELFVCVALTVSGAGLVLRAPLYLAAGALLLPLLKPEGGPYALLLCAVSALAMPHRAHLATALGTGAGLALWLPLRQQLLGQPAAGVALAVAAAVALLAVAARLAVVRYDPRPRVIAGTLALLIGLPVAAILVFGEGMAASGDALAVAVLRGVERVPERLAEVPSLLAGVVESLTFIRKVGMLYLVLLALLVLPRAVAGRCPSRALAGFLGCGLLLTVAALVLAPGADLAHEVRSRYDRLLLQWVGPGWLLVVPWLGRRLA